MTILLRYVVLFVTLLLPAQSWAVIAEGANSHGEVGSNSAATTAAVTTQASGSSFWTCAQYTGTFSSVADQNDTDPTNANTWTLVETALTISDSEARCYRANNGVGGTNHTVTWTMTAAGNVIVAFFGEVTGAATGAFDLGARGTDSATPFVSPGITPSQANILLIGYMGTEGAGGAAAFTPGNSFTTLDAVTDGDTYFPGYTSYRNVTSIASYNISTTVTGSVTSSGNFIMAFKDATPGGGGDVVEQFYKRRLP